MGLNASERARYEAVVVVVVAIVVVVVDSVEASQTEIVIAEL
jgi:hypothetical protein